MRKLRFLLLLTLASMLTVAGTASAATTTPDRHHTSAFTAFLTGSQEVPPHQIPSFGVAVFNLNRDGTELRFDLASFRIQDVILAHIHLGPPGVNGPIVVDLMDAGDCNSGSNTFTCRGTITENDLTGPLAGHPLSDLIDLMRSGQTYTNVHTTQFPAGAIRGQIIGFSHNQDGSSK